MTDPNTTPAPKPAPLTPFVDLKLNHISQQGGQKVVAAANSLPALVVGDPRPTLDDIFGRVLQFTPTDSLAFTNLADHLPTLPPDAQGSRLQGLVLTVWVRPQPEQLDRPLALWAAGIPAELTQKDAPVRAFWLRWEPSALVLQWSLTGTAIEALSVPLPLRVDEWTHLALRYDGKQIQLLANGQMMGQRDWADGLPWSAAAGLILGGSGRASDTVAGFAGRLAAVRLTSSLTTTTPETIQAQIEADLRRIAIGSHFPLEFSLHDARTQPILYLGEEPRTLQLEISNVGQQDLLLASQNGSVGVLELLFRPGTLLSPDKITLAPDTNLPGDASARWVLTTRRESNGIDVLTLTHRGGPAGEPGNALLTSEKTTLNLAGLLADARGGARTTRVQLRYRLHNSAGRPIEGSRLHYLSIVHLTESELQDQYVDLSGQYKQHTQDIAASRQTLADLQTRFDNQKELPAKVQTLDDSLKALTDTVTGSKGIQQEVTDLKKLVDDVNQQTRLMAPAVLRGLVDGRFQVVACDAGDVNKPLSRLRLIITNSDLNNALTLTVGQSKLRFHLAPDTPWGLYNVQADQSSFSIVVDPSDQWEHTPLQTPGAEGIITLTYKGGSGSLPPKGQVALELNFTCTALAGPATLRVDYESFKLAANPDSGTFYVTVERTGQRLHRERGVTYNPAPFDKQQDAGYLIPRGGVIMWSGATNNIPKGWALCNGQWVKPDTGAVADYYQDGYIKTPDLRDRFVMGAGNKNPNDTGGDNFIRIGIQNMPNHSHGVYDPGHSHNLTHGLWLRDSSTDIDDSSLPIYARNDAGKLEVNSNTTGISLYSTGGDQPIFFEPRYYALCFIMKL
ncbi:MAG: tail fiber protein [Chloroflexi bacterium]|nr:tail fiber protein [Chloroflexota bacterium]